MPPPGPEDALRSPPPSHLGGGGTRARGGAGRGGAGPRGAPGGVRTRTGPGLSRLPLPVGLRGPRPSCQHDGARPPSRVDGLRCCGPCESRQALAAGFASAGEPSAGEVSSALPAPEGFTSAPGTAAWSSSLAGAATGAASGFGFGGTDAARNSARGSWIEPRATVSRRHSRFAVQPDMIAILRFSVGIAMTWYDRCRTQAKKPRTLILPRNWATPLYMPRDATAPMFLCL